ncbi:amino-acid N-acetyltransferase [Algiphilus sp.]|uniref:amino-acid N-acetyltransferase n=1 Tax=Algiphilus sp. TaxID=1872431 RepID=UPI003B515D44
MAKDEPTLSFVSALRAAAPYVHAHRGRVFVVCFGGEAATADDFDALIYDIALLHSLGVRLVLVHGARPQIHEEIQRSGLTPRISGNLRVTDRPTLDCVMRAVGALRTAIEARLSTSLASTPMGGARLRTAGGNWVTARPVGVRDGVDFEHTGEVRRIHAGTMHQALDARQIVLLSPLGYSPTGEVFNLRAEDVATAAAAALGADKLVFVTPSEPRHWPLAEHAGDAGQIPASQAAQVLADSGEDLGALDADYIHCAVEACQAGVARVHLIGHAEDGALLRELYTRDGAGLFVHADDAYETTRPATIDDIGGILALITPLESAGALVPRSREQLELEIDHFTVTTRDGLVIACAALLPLGDSSAAELACVAVHADYRGAGRAEALLRQAEGRARRAGITELFALTTHTPHWFIEHGFTRSSPDALPVTRRELYNYQRNSLVLNKRLSA